MQQSIEKIIGTQVPSCIFEKAYRNAMNKKDHIIRLYGDENGSRNTQKYIQQLVIEQLQSMQMTNHCQINHFVKKMEKERTANSSTLLQEHSYSITN